MYHCLSLCMGMHKNSTRDGRASISWTQIYGSKTRFNNSFSGHNGNINRKTN